MFGSSSHSNLKKFNERKFYKTLWKVNIYRKTFWQDTWGDQVWISLPERFGGRIILGRPIWRLWKVSSGVRRRTEKSNARHLNYHMAKSKNEISYEHQKLSFSFRNVQRYVVKNVLRRCLKWAKSSLGCGEIRGRIISGRTQKCRWWCKEKNNEKWSHLETIVQIIQLSKLECGGWTNKVWK